MSGIKCSPMNINLLILGNCNVGKSCFIYRYVKEKFIPYTFSTIGFDCLQKKIKTPSGKNAKIVFYDTAGQERYNTIAFNLINNSDGILVMYDITDISTFQKIQSWIESITERKGKNFPIVLVGNKCDLTDKRVVSKEEGEKEAENYGFPFFETSCKDNINIEKAIIAIVNIISEEKYQTKLYSTKTLILEKKKLKKKKNKCKC